MNNILKSCLVLFIVSSVCVSALAYANEITKEPIRLQEVAAQNEANKKIFPNAAEFKAIEAALQPGSIINEVSEAHTGGEKLGYIVKLSQKGFGGPISMLVGINMDGSVSGLAVLSHSETAGLGANCEQEWFTDKFKGQKSFPLKVVKTAPKDGEIDAITSSTITTRYITDAVNIAHEWFLAEGGGK